MDDVEDARRSRRAREEIYDAGAIPKGDRGINPTLARTANDFYSDLKHAQSFHIQSGAHLGMLEREEHLLGQISYPQGHPRRSHVESGEYYPRGETIFHDRRSDSTPEPEPRSASKPTVPSGVALRSNRYSATCDVCGKGLNPGEGVIERTSAGYSVHHPSEKRKE